MTRETYRKLAEILSNQELYSFALRMCEAKGFDPAKEYPQSVDSEVIRSAARRHLYCYQTSETLRRAIFMGATEGEILRICEYLCVLQKSSDEQKLDFRRCASELGISFLEKKYSQRSFMNIDVPVDELEAVLKRDNGYYEVKIK